MYGAEWAATQVCDTVLRRLRDNRRQPRHGLAATFPKDRNNIDDSGAASASSTRYQEIVIVTAASRSLNVFGASLVNPLGLAL
jgi:hypothetical protein